jgi:hypothetical protein
MAASLQNGIESWLQYYTSIANGAPNSLFVSKWLKHFMAAQQGLKTVVEAGDGLGYALATGGQPQASTDTAAQANQLVQTLQQGLGTGNGLQMGSDFVGNLATGMHTQIPTISVASKTIGTNIAQQMIEGAMTQLGVNGGGVGGIGPGSTLADLVKWTVAEALASQNQNVWGDQHTPGGLHGGYGTWGQR